jgi:hypothetical protein
MAKQLAAIVVGLVALAISVTFSILVMIKGWGLEPVSYWWIIGVTFIAHTVSHLFLALAKAVSDG